MKKVSVLIACFNAEKYIQQCLRSLFVQSLDDYEIIIVDDGSTDSTVVKIQDAIKGQDNVFFFPREENLGTIKTRNELLKISAHNSEFIAWCDADDVYHRNKLEIQYDFLKKNPEYIGCGTWYKKFGRVNKCVFKFVNAKANAFFTCFGSPVGFPTFMQKNSPGVCFDERLDSGEDYAYVSELAKLGHLTNIKKFLTYYRVHDAQESTQNIKRQRKVHDQVSAEMCKYYLANQQNLYPFISNPLISNENSLNDFILHLNELEINNDKSLFVAIFDYRFLSYNKKNVKMLVKYSLRRNIKLIRILFLYLR
ncbi:MAG: glycosyltransferase family 2 protein [Erwinia billingiae]